MIEYIVGATALSLVEYLLITTIVDIILMGWITPKLSTKGDVSKYLIETKNRIDIQTGYKCSAFSVAYILRHYGMLANGEEIYPQIPNKMKAGYVYPKGILRFLSNQGFKVKYCIGNLNALEKEISKGNPVIVMIRVRPDKKWLHFVPVVGFDENYIYIADSLGELVNCDCTLYNRKVEIKEFLRLWNTAMIRQPFYKNTFMIIERIDNDAI